MIVAHNPVTSADDPSTRDVLAQVAWVVDGLRALEIEHRVMAVDGRAVPPDGIPAIADAIVNLVESPPGEPVFQVTAAEALTRLGLPCTGSGANAIRLTTDKLATRRRLAEVGVAVAAGGEFDPEDPRVLEAVPPPWILKPALEDASLGLDDGAVTSDPIAAVRRARLLRDRFRQPVLVEHLLPGREFNLSLLEGPGGLEVLPPAEMLFVDFPSDRPRVLGWEAKWDETSFASRHTVRRFLAPGSEPALIALLDATARAAWTATGVSGYARVDLRLDEAGTPSVLEVNANPCLAADAGFVAAAAAAGLDAAAVVARLLESAGAHP